jgi:NAD(P)-dependent dehydrogenase (short-subunit alcohol dehydrogenase family)/phage shock protein A/DNA-binding XRE family transcriptional regulator
MILSPMNSRSYVITGASTGIGRASVTQIVRTGAHVWASVRTDEDEKALLRDYPDAVTVLRMDLADPDSVRAAGERVCAAGPLHGLVNNAGVALPGPLEHIPLDVFRRQLEVNLVGQLAVTQAMLPALRQAREQNADARIVMIGSIGGRIATSMLGLPPWSPGCRTGCATASPPPGAEGSAQLDHAAANGRTADWAAPRERHSAPTAGWHAAMADEIVRLSTATSTQMLGHDLADHLIGLEREAVSMGYRLQMHAELRDWLTGLASTEPEVARLVGEAVLALLEAGEDLGPPLVVALQSALATPADPREALDYSYQRQLEALTTVRRSVADVATSRKRVELQASQLEEAVARLAAQRNAALDAGQAEAASEARAREAAVQGHLADMRRHLSALSSDESRLTAASQRLQAKVDAFRVRKETLKAGYTAALASRVVAEAFAGIDEDASDLEAGSAAECATTLLASATTPGDETLQQAEDLVRGFPGGSGSTDQGDVPAQEGVTPPPGCRELRPGAPGNARVGLLFVIDRPDTVVLVERVRDPGGPAANYREATQVAAARLALARQSRAAGQEAPAAAFISCDAESFIDEFFPGVGPEVELAADVLLARNRAHTLRQARKRIGLTQAQVAERMNLRQERVSAIERADPGATEVRTLAAYVRALGGRLEIVADLGAERIVLK